MATSYTDKNVQDFIEGVASPIRRRDAATLLAMMTRVTGDTARMWGTSIVGFGQYHYKYTSGREGDSPAAGYSPRKAAVTVYLADGVGAHAAELARLGEHSTGAGCLYLKNLDNIDLDVLEVIVGNSYRTVTADTLGQRTEQSNQEQRDQEKPGQGESGR